MADKSKTIIVKKIKKGHGGGHHGGQWKVAYADFVTAMMAFFLLMWLLAMVSPEKRAAVAEYFKNFSLFEESGKSFMSESSQIFQQTGGEVKTSTTEFAKGPGEIPAEGLKEKLKKAVEEKLKALKDHIMVDIYEGKIRVQVVDTEGKPIFYPGSTELTSSAKEILSLLADNLKDMPNKIAVEGHTDSAPLSRGQMTNWELSTGRASSARRDLETKGIDAKRVARVVGYADTELLFKDNPLDARNRRISIIILQEKVKLPVQLKEEPKTETPLPPPPPMPLNQPETQQTRKAIIEKPAPDKDISGFEKAIKPISPLTAPFKQPEEKPGKATEEKTAPIQQQRKDIKGTEKQMKPVPPLELKKPLIEKPPDKQEKKKDIKSELGVKSQKPFDIIKPSIVPDIDKGGER